MANDRKSMRIEKRKAETKYKIIRSAMELFTELGYSKTTVNLITERADIGYGTFYQHFANKSDLLSRLSDEACDNIKNYFQPADQKLTFQKNVEYGIRCVFECYIANRDLFIVLQNAMLVDEVFKDYWNRIQTSLFGSVSKEIMRFIKKRTNRVVQVEEISRAITYMLDGYANYVIMQSDAAPDVEYISLMLADLCLHAISGFDSAESTAI